MTLYLPGGSVAGGRHSGRHGGGQDGQGMLHFGESVVHTGVDLLGPNFFDLKLTTRLAHLLSFANIFFYICNNFSIQIFS